MIKKILFIFKKKFACFKFICIFFRNRYKPINLCIMSETNLLNLKSGNTKLDKFTYVFDLPAGHVCVGARDCLSKSNRETGLITDGKFTRFRCYAASNECIFSKTRAFRWHNYDLLKEQKNTKQIVSLLQKTLDFHVLDEKGRNKKMLFVIKKDSAKENEKVKFRIHSSGDFYSQNYFDAWLEIAKRHPQIVFYTYTKSLHFWVKRLKEIPENLVLNASYGGKFDNLIKEHNLKATHVVFSPDEAVEKGLPTDHTDRLGWDFKGDFALLLHGTQPAGSEASKANQKMRKENVGNGFYMKVTFASDKKTKKKKAA